MGIRDEETAAELNANAYHNCDSCSGILELPPHDRGCTCKRENCDICHWIMPNCKCTPIGAEQDRQYKESRKNKSSEFKELEKRLDKVEKVLNQILNLSHNLK